MAAADPVVYLRPTYPCSSTTASTATEFNVIKPSSCRCSAWRHRRLRSIPVQAGPAQPPIQPGSRTPPWGSWWCPSSTRMEGSQTGDPALGRACRLDCRHGSRTATTRATRPGGTGRPRHPGGAGLLADRSGSPTTAGRRRQAIRAGRREPPKGTARVPGPPGTTGESTDAVISYTNARGQRAPPGPGPGRPAAIM